jgi:uncharacterized membrane protein YecN with MAPEG domain
MPVSPPVISALTAGILIITQMALLFAVTRARRSNRQSLGDGGKGELLRAIRRHGNFAENAAIFIAGFALLELMGVGRIGLAVLCGAFVLARIAHIVGLSMKNTVNVLRVGGTVVTVFVGVAVGIRLIACAVRFLTA